MHTGSMRTNYYKDSSLAIWTFHSLAGKRTRDVVDSYISYTTIAFVTFRVHCLCFDATNWTWNCMNRFMWSMFSLCRYGCVTRFCMNRWLAQRRTFFADHSECIHQFAVFQFDYDSELSNMQTAMQLGLKLS